MKIFFTFKKCQQYRRIHILLRTQSLTFVIYTICALVAIIYTPTYSFLIEVHEKTNFYPYNDHTNVIKLQLNDFFSNQNVTDFLSNSDSTAAYVQLC